MFKGFNLLLTKEWFGEAFNELNERGVKHLKKQKYEDIVKLSEYVTAERIDGTKIQDAWFPLVDADIFISHSGEDKELACALAGWLNETFGLKCFVDFNVWGYAEHLLREMNSQLSNETKAGNGEIWYDYQSCNKVSQHVNAMLSIAIQKMIDKTEATILLNTEHSIPVHSNNEMNETYSPWIYTELVCTQIVRQKPLIVYRDYDELEHSSERTLFEDTRDLTKSLISYKAPLMHLIKLDTDDLRKWENIYYGEKNCREKYPMDLLYYMKCSKDLAEAHKNYSREEISRIRKMYT